MNNRGKTLFTGASDDRITPDLKALKAQFAAQRAAAEAGTKRPREEEEAPAPVPTRSERPIERSAKTRTRTGDLNATALDEIVKKHRPSSTREAADPRFSNMYGAFNKSQYQQSYGFLDDKEKDEQVIRLDRFRKLNLIVKHLSLEAKGANLDDYGILAQEDEMFEGDKDTLREMLYTPVDKLRREADDLKKVIDGYKSKFAQQASKERALAAQKRVMKAEVEAVKAGKKAKPFIPGRKDMRKAVEANRFDYLESVGGAGQANKFLEKKRVKKTNIR